MQRGSIRTGNTCRSRKNRGVSLQVALAATSKSTVVAFEVGLTTEWAPVGGRSTKVLVMSPFPTLLTEGGTYMSVSTLDTTWHTVNDNGLTDEFFGIEPQSGIPDVEIDPAGITVGSSFNDAWIGYQVDPFLEHRSKK